MSLIEMEARAFGVVGVVMCRSDDDAIPTTITEGCDAGRSGNLVNESIYLK